MKLSIKLLFSLFIFSQGCKTIDPGIVRNNELNIIFIVADDLGKEALSIYGGESIATPNLEALSNSSNIYTNCYSSPICNPTRASFITGKYPSQNGMKVLLEPFQALQNQPSIANIFKKAGYQTAVVGKWHLADLESYPDHIGQFDFDSYFVHYIWKGVTRQVTNRYYEPTYYSNNEVISFREDQFGPDLELVYAKNFIEENRKNPYFLYYALNLPHYPYVRPPKDGKVYDNESDPVNYPLLVEYMDEVIGNLIAFLKEIDDFDNSIIVFVGDNGSPRSVVNLQNGESITGGKLSFKENGINVPLTIKYPNQRTSARVDDLIDFTDFYTTFSHLLDIPLENDMDIEGNIFHSFTGTIEKRKWIFSELNNNWAIREDKFKLTSVGEVYDLVNDPNEMTPIVSISDEIESRIGKLNSVALSIITN